MRLIASAALGAGVAAAIAIAVTLWVREDPQPAGGPGRPLDDAAGGGTSTPAPGRISFAGSVFGPAPSLLPYSAAGSQGADYSLTDPNTHGAVVVHDPRGLRRRVIKLTTDEAKGDGDVVRMQLNGPKLLGEGSHVWILNEFLFPRGFPTLAADGWMTLSSVYGRPYGGPGPNSIGLRAEGGRNQLVWKDEAGDTYRDLWRAPAGRGVWHVVARHMYLSEDPAKGYMEIWYARRGHPLKLQRLTGPAAGSTRRYYRTLEPGVNWETDRSSPYYHDLDSSNISNYHKDGMPGWSGLVSVYFADHRIFPGTLRPEQIDPYERRRRASGRGGRR